MLQVPRKMSNGIWSMLSVNNCVTLPYIIYGSVLITVLSVRVLSLLQSTPKGISDKDIQNEVAEPQERAKIINSLLQKVGA